MENLARYIIRASFSQKRMRYLPGEASAKTGHRESGQVEYRSKDGSEIKVFDAPVSSTGQALEWMAAMCSHVPGKGEQMVRYYGYYSPAGAGSRGKRINAMVNDKIPCILEPEMTDKAFRKNWARLIQKIGACPGPDPGKLIPFAAPGARVPCG